MHTTEWNSTSVMFHQISLWTMSHTVYSTKVQSVQLCNSDHCLYQRAYASLKVPCVYISVYQKAGCFFGLKNLTKHQKSSAFLFQMHCLPPCLLACSLLCLCILVHCQFSWHIIATCQSVEKCDSIGRNMYPVTHVLVSVHIIQTNWGPTHQKLYRVPLKRKFITCNKHGYDMKAAAGNV